MKRFARFLFMKFYREELLEISKDVRKAYSLLDSSSTDIRVTSRYIGVLDTLETLDLLDES